ncbi:hypothetical protein CSKR_104021, partial [Clonorchis sinensis]
WGIFGRVSSEDTVLPEIQCLDEIGWVVPQTDVPTLSSALDIFSQWPFISDTRTTMTFDSLNDKRPSRACRTSQLQQPAVISDISRFFHSYFSDPSGFPDCTDTEFYLVLDNASSSCGVCRHNKQRATDLTFSSYSHSFCHMNHTEATIGRYPIKQRHFRPVAHYISHTSMFICSSVCVTKSARAKPGREIRRCTRKPAFEQDPPVDPLASVYEHLRELCRQAFGKLQLSVMRGEQNGQSLLLDLRRKYSNLGGEEWNTEDVKG